MAKFVYRMQGILNVKEKMESQAKNEFAIASAALNEEVEKLNVLVFRKEGFEHDLEMLYRDILDINEISKTQDAIENLKYQIKLQEIRVSEAEQALEQTRMKLTEAMLERKTHDKLKEKQFEEFLAEESAKESKEIDELVSYRYGQKEEG